MRSFVKLLGEEEMRMSINALKTARWPSRAAIIEEKL